MVRRGYALRKHVFLSRLKSQVSNVQFYEKLGRAVAYQQKVEVIGTGGVLLAAKQKGLINSVSPILNNLRAQGYRIADDLCARILSLANEG